MKKFVYHIDIRTSLTLTIYIHRKITVIITFRNLNIPDKRSIGAKKTGAFYVVIKFGPFPTNL